MKTTTLVGKIEGEKVQKEFYRQGLVFKDADAYNKGEGVCYVPELSDYRYTRSDFLKIAKGNTTLSDAIFELCDWQHPETVMLDLQREKDEILEKI